MTTIPITEDNPDRLLDYQLCTVPGSRLQFRGPLPSFGRPFVAVLGGNETFGKYVHDPFPALLSNWAGLPVANLGVPQAGLTLFSEEQVLLELASSAEVTVLQVLGAQNMSNRLYSVHSRRNDRFLGVSPALREIFPQVDFAQINFTGHLIGTLRDASDTAFKVLVDELKWAWVQRMQRILSLIESKVILVWIKDHADPGVLGLDPSDSHFVDITMIDEIRSSIDDVVQVTLNGTSELAGKIYPDGEQDAALSFPNQADHARIAEALAPVVMKLLSGSGQGSTLARTEDQSSFSISSGTAAKRSATRP